MVRTEFMRFGDTVLMEAVDADATSSKDSDSYREKVGPDEANLSEPEGTVMMFAQECEVLRGADDAGFAHRHFGEIGIADDTDIAALANALIGIGGVFEEGTDPRFLLVHTVRFV
ncbi:hypothetical protein IP81_16315 [Novosphingobium sp. AAP83]|nr:hypothetical protein IP81_16315 [Novosphingobium sp. AAP83]